MKELATRSGWKVVMSDKKVIVIHSPSEPLCRLQPTEVFTHLLAVHIRCKQLWDENDTLKRELATLKQMCNVEQVGSGTPLPQKLIKTQLHTPR